MSKVNPPIPPAGQHSEGTLKPIRKPARDPLIIKMEQAYRASRQYELDKLLRKQTLYRRRLTLAQSGLENTQREIYEFLHALAQHRLSESISISKSVLAEKSKESEK